MAPLLYAWKFEDDLEDDLAEIVNTLGEVAAKWSVIATNLHLKGNEINSIRNSDQERLISVISEWLKMNYNYERFGPPSWQMLARAVQPINGRLFRRICKEHRINKWKCKKCSTCQIFISILFAAVWLVNVWGIGNTYIADNILAIQFAWCNSTEPHPSPHN